MAVLQDIAAIVHQSVNIVEAAVEYKLSDKFRQVESGLTRAIAGWGLLKVFFLLIAAGMGFLLWGLYGLLATKVSGPGAALILGGAVLLAGVVICLTAVQTASKK